MLCKALFSVDPQEQLAAVRRFRHILSQLSESRTCVCVGGGVWGCVCAVLYLYYCYNSEELFNFSRFLLNLLFALGQASFLYIDIVI